MTSDRPVTPLLTVDAVISRSDGDWGEVVLIERRNPPFGWALPGGFVDLGESVEQAVQREALEETGLQITLRGLLGVYSQPDRDPRGHTVSIVYTGRGRGVLRAADDAVEAAFFRLDSLPTGIAFDHRAILADYAEWLKSKPSGGNFHA